MPVGCWDAKKTQRGTKEASEGGGNTEGSFAQNWGQRAMEKQQKGACRCDHVAVGRQRKLGRDVRSGLAGYIQGRTAEAGRRRQASRHVWASPAACMGCDRACWPCRRPTSQPAVAARAPSLLLSLPHGGGVALCGHQVVKVVQNVVAPAIMRGQWKQQPTWQAALGTARLLLLRLG